MIKELNSTQKKIIQVFQDNGCKLPSFRELAKTVGVSSTNTIAYHITKLKENGYLGLEKTENGVVKFNIKNILQLNSKSGVYVLLKNKTPFYIGESKNIKRHILDNVVKLDCIGVKEIEENPENISIAYYFLNSTEEKLDLKNHLINFYSQKGIPLPTENNCK